MDISVYLLLLAALLREVLNEQLQWKHKLEPEFLNTPTNITLYRGELAILRCHIRNPGPKMVVWRKENDDVLLTVGDTIFKQEETHISIEFTEVSEDEAQYDLIIKDVRPRHAGTYLCQVSATKLYTHYVTLHVLDQPIILEGSLQLTGTKFVDQGETIRLVCNVTGATRAPDGIDWFLNGNRIVSSHAQWRDRTEISKHRMGRTFISELEIDHSTLSDRGMYVCRASDLTISSLTVDVLSAEKPNIGPRSPDDRASYSQANDGQGSTASQHVPSLFTQILTLTVSMYFIYVSLSRNTHSADVNNRLMQLMSKQFTNVDR